MTTFSQLLDVCHAQTYDQFNGERSPPFTSNQMFNNLIAALAITSFGLGAMPAKANTTDKYFAAGVFAAAICDVNVNGETADHAVKAIEISLTARGIPTSYGSDPTVKQLAHAYAKAKGCV